MGASDLTEYVQQLRLDGDALADARVREVIGKVLNLVEAVVVENRRLQDENQRLREIIRQLKGEAIPSATAVPFAGAGYLVRERTAATYAPAAWFPRRRPPELSRHSRGRGNRLPRRSGASASRRQVCRLRRRGCAGSSHPEPQHPLPSGALGFAVAGTAAWRTAAAG